MKLIKSFLISFSLFLVYSNLHAQQKPNIIYILADDLGSGDVSCFNKNSKIHTPHIDALAQQGMKFTDAHTNSSVCSPTRYGIITGRYAWRSTLKNGVLNGLDSPIISNSRMTVASLLKKHNYQTGCIGKWHLGLDFGNNNKDKVNINTTVKNGPNQLGFDYSYIIPASMDMPFYCFIKNEKLDATSLDTIAERKGKKFARGGTIAKGFVMEEALLKQADEAVNFIKNTDKSKPYFLYLPLTAPHTPILPTKAYEGKSKTNEFGDFVLMVDDIVGQVSEAVKASGSEQNTLIIFTSDNGCSPASDFKELSSLGHHSSYVYRGMKSDIFEGGHRVPFIAKWPKIIKPNTISTNTICSTDLMATCAEIVNEKLPDNAGEDSFSMLPLFNNMPQKHQREATVHHSIKGFFAIRKGPWKLALTPGSGGWSTPKNEKEEVGLPTVQLYNLDKDIAETQNLQAENPEKVKELTQLLVQYVNNGRSTKGTPQPNEGKFLNDRMPWLLSDFMQKRFGMFIHWGPVSLRGAEIGWSRGHGISPQEYDSLYKEFNPTLFDANAWVKAAKDAGMKYVTLTSKHHDGFCLWPTKTSDYNIMSSPFKRDVVGELAAACRKQGIAFCLYYTVLDWHDPNYGMHNLGDTLVDPKADMKKFVATMKTQLSELITNYHPYMLWFDGNWEKPWTKAMGQEVYDHIKRLDPNVIINNRLGKGNHKTLAAETVGDFATPEQVVGSINMDAPWESCITICKQWAWKPNDQMKSLKESIQTLASTAGGNGNLLYNVGPMPDGRIEARQIQRLAEMGNWLKKYGASIYETQGGPYKPNKVFTTTRRGNKIYVHVFKADNNTLSMPALPNAKIKKVYLMNGSDVDFEQNDSAIILKFKSTLPDENDSVVVFELDKDTNGLPLIETPK